MTTRLPQTKGAPHGVRARRILAALASLATALLLAASAPMPVLGPEAGSACPVGTGNCGG